MLTARHLLEVVNAPERWLVEAKFLLGWLLQLHGLTLLLKQLLTNSKHVAHCREAGGQWVLWAKVDTGAGNNKRREQRATQRPSVLEVDHRRWLTAGYLSCQFAPAPLPDLATAGFAF